ncbi:Rossmann-fold NAD(P)-binding domain-containing protein [Thermocoleostomius sinensis]|uniref:Alanine dehydrogenase/pyridine nucleotide transhydrogenase NAD(H)-binding domain-containing protein n=1 Tax=Thermocoleostomius sinensis A174 TaxID=2016057 RepID=A0A9E8ZEX9_9CYAN|nr:hypothetical protein [Thermocoleostomius sinensis]WAL61777.1 hypothetical protein OXH18_07285 [Thermocoleostomius sinensis A174]
MSEAILCGESNSKKYSLGFISHSLSNRERRVPIWWEHLTFDKLNHPLIKDYIFEENFGFSAFREPADIHLTRLGCKVADRLSVLNLSDIVISLKPKDEWRYMKPESTLIGWFNHLESSPQRSSAIRLLSFEDINIIVEGRLQKLLYNNAYVAGECGVAQTLEILREIAPLSPAVLSRKRLAVVLGYGNLGQGAVAELIRQGIEQIIVFTQRQPITIENKFAGVDYRQMICGSGNTYAYDSKGSTSSLITEILCDADIIVNAALPSSNQSSCTFIPWNDFNQLKRDMVYIDPVHTVGHGASFAQATQLAEPVKQICQLNHSIWYNGCNAMPSYRPAHASFVISQAITTYLDELLSAVENVNKVLL